MDLQSRVVRAQDAMRDAGTDLLIVTPGADLRYLTGYDAMPLERLTALVLPVSGDPVLVVPALEAAEAERSPAALAGMSIVAWDETDDPHLTALDAVGVDGSGSLTCLTVDDHMWARHIRAFVERVDAPWRTAGHLLGDLRLRKNGDEINSLRRAASAIDRVHARIEEWLRVGRTERDVARDIADAIVEEGHANADFTIVASGENAASPHHGVSDKVIAAGDPVVIDIGGSTRDGYCSDSTRTYLVDGKPPDGFTDAYAVLLEAQRAQCEYARPGVTAESVDRVGRSVIGEAGYGPNFIHRTGHGIGLEVHEDPYIVEGNTLTLEPGMAFSIEPGIYVEGRHGARIEDIVVVTADGVERLNTRPRDLAVVPG
jgi:Xaa-Pro aminopeptidase